MKLLSFYDPVWQHAEWHELEYDVWDLCHLRSTAGFGLTWTGFAERSESLKPDVRNGVGVGPAGAHLNV